MRFLRFPRQPSLVLTVNGNICTTFHTSRWLSLDDASGTFVYPIALLVVLIMNPRTQSTDMKTSKATWMKMGMLLMSIGLIWTMINHNQEVKRYEAKIAELEQEVGYCMEQWGKVVNTPSDP